MRKIRTLRAMISYSVAQRTREIGIRMAMGAQRGTLTAMFLRGLGAAALSSAMKSMLFEVQPVDPVTFALAPVVLMLVAALASCLPALRPTSVDPLEALRAD